MAHRYTFEHEINNIKLISVVSPTWHAPDIDLLRKVGKEASSLLGFPAPNLPMAWVE